MGIPRLITYLRPFASTTDLADHSAVIDGPGLAFHAWHICLSSEEVARNPFEAAPSYRLLGETVIRWLDELQAHHICLKKIFFDGSLPSSKRPTRINRIMGNTKQLNQYNQAWPQVIPSGYIDTSSRLFEERLFNDSSPVSRFSTFPAAPFLVPAIIETLFSCERYADLIEVVPGEADLYCAGYVRSHGGVVFTGDSDLLLHDLGDGRVCFFKDIDLTASTSSASLKCMSYEIGTIVQRLCLDKSHGLLALAFEMTMDAHASFRELLQKALKLSAVKMHQKAYQDFASEYKALHSRLELQEARDSGNISHSQPLSHLLGTLDPRISEYVLQFSEISRAAGLSTPLGPRSITHGSSIDVFLPFLLDCPLRTSAWEMSTRVRQLAYGLINLVLPKEESILQVFEYRRLRNSHRGTELQIPTARELSKECEDLLGLFQKMQVGPLSKPILSIWRALAIYQDQELHLGTTKPALTTTLIEPPKDGKTSPLRLTWDAIHLSAQFQGSYYSFRILKQILSVVLLHIDTNPVPSHLHRLHIALRSLPCLDEVPPVLDAIRSIGDLDDQLLLKMIQEYLGIQPEGNLFEVQKNRNRNNSKARYKSVTSKYTEKQNSQAGQDNQADSTGQQKSCRIAKKPNNIFEVLSSD